MWSRSSTNESYRLEISGLFEKWIRQRELWFNGCETLKQMLVTTWSEPTRNNLNASTGDEIALGLEFPIIPSNDSIGVRTSSFPADRKQHLEVSWLILRSTFSQCLPFPSFYIHCRFELVNSLLIIPGLFETLRTRCWNLWSAHGTSRSNWRELYCGWCGVDAQTDWEWVPNNFHCYLCLLLSLLIHIRLHIENIVSDHVTFWVHPDSFV